MKKILTLITFACLGILSSAAQDIADDYYRVHSGSGDNYITLVNNKIDDTNMEAVKKAGGAMVYALRLENMEEAISDPGSIIYIKKGASGYVLEGKGMDTYTLTQQNTSSSGIYLQIRNSWGGQTTPAGAYWVYGSQSGATRILFDSGSNSFDYDINYAGEMKSYNHMVCVGEQSTGSYVRSNTLSNWYFEPIDNDKQYFGIRPESDIAINGKYYTTIYCSFPFECIGDVKAYYVTGIKSKYGAAKLTLIEDGKVPAATPVIIECTSLDPKDNKVIIGAETTNSYMDSRMKGAYFCYIKKSTKSKKDNLLENDKMSELKNVVTYNSASMRVLGLSKDGKLAFVKPDNSKLHVTDKGKYMRANMAYLQVVDAAETILLTDDGVAAEEPVTITAKSYTREYGEKNPEFEFTTTGGELNGTPEIVTEATEKSPVGTYDIVIKNGNVTNESVTFVNGTLTITKAPLTAKATDAERNEGEENPVFVINYSGWKLNETEDVLTKLPVAQTTATKESPAGIYDIIVSGGEAQNYEFKYENGQLTVKEVSGIYSIVGDAQTMPIYNIHGQKVADKVADFNTLPRGLYIINGKKVIK